MKFLFSGAFGFALVFLGGCDAQHTPALQGAARSIRIAEAFDKVQLAARNEDIEAMTGAMEELQRADAFATFPKMALPMAETAVGVGSIYDTRARKVSGEVRQALLNKSATQYRLALQLDPQFPSKDADSLNALGYFLAERGSSSDDFTRAEILTRSALAILNREIGSTEKRGEDVSALKFAHANTRDSLAWALFRQKRCNEALIEQTAAIDEAKSLTAVAPLPAELRFHLGAIFQALGKTAEARSEYEAALKLEPDDENARRALDSLTKTQSADS